MSKKANKSKNVYGSTVKRSEYSDDILRDNQRTGNRLKIDMHYYDRAQKVIMKDLGKESLILQNKLQSDRKTLSLGLYGSKIGVSGSQSTPRYASTSPQGTVRSSSSFRPTMRSTSRSEAKFPWDKDPSDKASSVLDKDSGVSHSTSPLLKGTNRRFSSSLSTGYPTPRAPTDDFLASILNEAMQDEMLYTQLPESRASFSRDVQPSKTPHSSRRKSKISRSRMTTPNDSIVNALSNTSHDTDEVIY